MATAKICESKECKGMKKKYTYTSSDYKFCPFCGNKLEKYVIKDYRV